MKVKISIEEIVDFDHVDIFDELMGETDIDTRVDYLVNRFCEDVDYAVKYDKVRDLVGVEYIES